MPSPELHAVEVLVEVAMPELETRVSEEAWKLDILKAVGTAVYADKTLPIRNVRLMTSEDCEWIYESGIGDSEIQRDHFSRRRLVGND